MNEVNQIELKVENLEISLIRKGYEPLKIVDGVSFEIKKGEIIGIVGESGCGKTLTALGIMRLLSDPPLRITGGKILFKGENLLEKSKSRMRKIRGKEISMIFQEPMSALDPTMTVGNQVMEIFKIHLGLGKRHALSRTIELFNLVGIPDAEKRVYSYPHELSGGMAQRVLIAMAIACNPSLIIADEPTTALDATIQAQVLDLLKRLQTDFETSMIFISHDLSVIAHIASRVYVMYSGQIIEEGPTEDIFGAPIHPYTLALMGSVPKLEDVAMGRGRLTMIPGKVSGIGERVKGCKYAPRCEFAFDRCTEFVPPLYKYTENRKSRCFLIASEHNTMTQMKTEETLKEKT